MFALGDFVVVVEFPDDTAHVVAMLTFHPVHHLSAAGFLCSHEGGNLSTEGGGETGGIIAVDTQEKLPEQRLGHRFIFGRGDQYLDSHLVFGFLDKLTSGMLGDILVIGCFRIGLDGFIPVDGVNHRKNLLPLWGVGIISEIARQLGLVSRGKTQ